MSAIPRVKVARVPAMISVLAALLSLKDMPAQRHTEKLEYAAVIAAANSAQNIVASLRFICAKEISHMA